MNRMGKGLLVSMRDEMNDFARAGKAASMEVSLPWTTFARWSEDIAIALGLPPAADVVDPHASDPGTPTTRV